MACYTPKESLVTRGVYHIYIFQTFSFSFKGKVFIKSRYLFTMSSRVFTFVTNMLLTKYLYGLYFPFPKQSTHPTAWQPAKYCGQESCYCLLWMLSFLLNYIRTWLKDELRSEQ